MVNCKILQYKGQTKAETIRMMIETKIRNKLNETKGKELKIKFKKEISSLRRLVKRENKLSDEIKKQNKQLDNFAKEEKMSYNKGQFTMDNYSNCFIPDAIVRDLQKAVDFQSLGKRKEANEIYERLIKEYKLV